MAHDAHDAPYDAGDRRTSSTENHADAAAPADTLVSGTVGDRCVNCSAPLSSDQRYCVVCGERRGAPRFALPAATAAQAAAAPPARSRARGPRFGQGPTLIAGVATLLLAMLVGVLIGHGIGSKGTQTVASAPVRIITTGGGTSAPAAASSGSSAGTAKSRTTKSTKTKAKAKKSAPKVTKKAAKAEASAASKVLGGKSTPPPTVTVGAKGTGKGYSKKTHKFTGAFFGQ